VSNLLVLCRPSSLRSESPGFSVSEGRACASAQTLRARSQADPAFAARLGGGQLAIGGARALRFAQRGRLEDPHGGWEKPQSVALPYPVQVRSNRQKLRHFLTDVRHRVVPDARSLWPPPNVGCCRRPLAALPASLRAPSRQNLALGTG